LGLQAVYTLLIQNLNARSALAAVTQYGMALQYVSERLREDKDFILAAVTQDGRALEYASKRLQDDDDIKKPRRLKAY
jgi:hypothetical protein